MTWPNRSEMRPTRADARYVNKTYDLNLTTEQVLAIWLGDFRSHSFVVIDSTLGALTHELGEGALLMVALDDRRFKLGDGSQTLEPNPLLELLLYTDEPTRFDVARYADVTFGEVFTAVDALNILVTKPARLKRLHPKRALSIISAAQHLRFPITDPIETISFWQSVEGERPRPTPNRKRTDVTQTDVATEAARLAISDGNHKLAEQITQRTVSLVASRNQAPRCRAAAPYVTTAMENTGYWPELIRGIRETYGLTERYLHMNLTATTAAESQR